MRWWGWLLTGILTLVIVGFVINLFKLTFWLLIVIALLMVIGWLVGAMYRVLSNIWPG